MTRNYETGLQIGMLIGAIIGVIVTRIYLGM